MNHKIDLIQISRRFKKKLSWSFQCDSFVPIEMAMICIESRWSEPLRHEIGLSAWFGGSIMGLLVPRQKPKWAQFPSWDHILGPISETWLKLLLVPSGLFWYPIVKSPILVRKRSQNTNLVWKFFEISKISWPPRACVFYWTYDGHM